MTTHRRRLAAVTLALTGTAVLSAVGAAPADAAWTAQVNYCGLPGAILGTSGADVLTGTSGPDTICGLGGADTVYGKGGADKIFGGEGDDTLYGGLQDDLIDGETGNDVIYGEDGVDFMVGGAGKDVAWTGPWTGGWETWLGHGGDAADPSTWSFDIGDGIHLGNDSVGETDWLVVETDPRAKGCCPSWY